MVVYNRWGGYVHKEWYIVLNVSDFSLYTDTSGENVTESIVSEGLVEVRRMGLKPEEWVLPGCGLFSFLIFHIA